MTELRTDHPLATHELAIVYQFRDTFLKPTAITTPLVRNRLEVSMPTANGPWIAQTSADGTYRFRARRGEVPAGSFPVTVRSLDGVYVNYEAFDALLPIAPPGPPTAADYLFTRDLWPTRLFRVPDGETAVLGSIKHATLPVADLKVEIYKGVSPPPGTPYTRTDARGEFLYRLYSLPVSMIPGATDTLKIRVQEVGVPISVTPSTFTVELGKTQFLSFTRT